MLHAPALAMMATREMMPVMFEAPAEPFGTSCLPQVSTLTSILKRKKSVPKIEEVKTANFEAEPEIATVDPVYMNVDAHCTAATDLRGSAEWGASVVSAIVLGYTVRHDVCLDRLVLWRHMASRCSG